VMDWAAFPEKHVTCTPLFRGKRLSSNKKTRWAAMTTKRKSRKGKDVLDNVFEDAEAQCCVPKSHKHMHKLLSKEGDVLDYVCENVESAICGDDDSYIDEEVPATSIKVRRKNAKSETFIQRDNTLFDADSNPQKGDVLVVKGASDDWSNVRPSFSAPMISSAESTDKKKDATNTDEDGLDYVFKNVDSEVCTESREEGGIDIMRDKSLVSDGQAGCYDQGTGSDSSLHPPPASREKNDVPEDASIPPYFDNDFIPYGVRRDRSLLSESSMASSVTRDPRHETRNEGMELILGPERKKKPSRRKNLVSLFMSPKSKKAPRASKASKRALAEF
jgi:hypothetical protein